MNASCLELAGITAQLGQVIQTSETTFPTAASWVFFKDYNKIQTCNCSFTVLVKQMIAWDSNSFVSSVKPSKGHWMEGTRIPLNRGRSTWMRTPEQARTGSTVWAGLPRVSCQNMLSRFTSLLCNELKTLLGTILQLHVTLSPVIVLTFP